MEYKEYGPELNEMTEAEQKEALSYDGNNIQFIKNPSEKLQKLAVQQDGFSIK